MKEIKEIQEGEEKSRFSQVPSFPEETVDKINQNLRNFNLNRGDSLEEGIIRESKESFDQELKRLNSEDSYKKKMENTE